MRCLVLLLLTACASTPTFGPDRTAIVRYEDGVRSCVTPPGLFAFTPEAKIAASGYGFGASISRTVTGTTTYDLDERSQYLSSALFRVCELRAQDLITSTQAASLFQMVTTDAADLLDVRRK